MTALRAWQIDAKDTFAHLGEPRDFTVCATPGAGKTTLALSHANDLRRRGLIDQIVVIVPTDALRTQWADDSAREGIDLIPARDAADYGHPDYDGFVLTYAQLKEGGPGAQLTRRALAQRRTLVIPDEIHHAGDQASWGRGLIHACEHATYRLMLTGTPWRAPERSQIPFVTYIDGRLKADFTYEYGQAVADDVCRQAVIEAYDCETVRWVDSGRITETALNEQLQRSDIPAVLSAVYDPGSDWIRSLLTEADCKLTTAREEVADTGGIIFAESQWHARAYAALLRDMTGEDPTLVISDDGPSAKAALDAFRRSNARWIVAVAMVSEGVDIPRLAVGVYASKTQTPLFFRQTLGRLVRSRADEDLQAVMFIPAVPQLMQHAREIEQELRHQLDLDIEQMDKQMRDQANAQQEMTFRETLSASPALFNSAIISGEKLAQDEIDAAAQWCRENRIPLTWAPNVALGMRKDRGREITVTVTPPTPSLPKHRLAKRLRGEIKRLIGKLEYREGMEPGTLNGDLLRQGFTPRGEMTVEELRGLLDHLAAWYDNG